MDKVAEKLMALAKEIKELFEKFETKPENRRTKGATNTQLTRLNASYQSFEEDHIKALKLQAANPEHSYFTSSSDTAIDDAYWDVWGQFAYFLLNLEAAAQVKVDVARETTSVLQEAFASFNYLPKIDLPVFSVKFTEWENFRDYLDLLCIVMIECF